MDDSLELPSNLESFDCLDIRPLERPNSGVELVGLADRWVDFSMVDDLTGKLLVLGEAPVYSLLLIALGPIGDLAVEVGVVPAADMGLDRLGADFCTWSR